RPARIGHRIKCKHCGQAFRAQRTAEPTSPATNPTTADAAPMYVSFQESGLSTAQLRDPANPQAAEEVAREPPLAGAARDPLPEEPRTTPAEPALHSGQADAPEPLIPEREPLAAESAAAAREQEQLHDRIAQLERAVAEAETTGAARDQRQTQG